MNRTSKSRKIRMLEEKETYKYLKILEADTIKQARISEKIKKENLRIVVFKVGGTEPPGGGDINFQRGACE